ncbi:hypothetical protein [Kitasatospora sp. NPDC058190]|uniref:hypothetical protein n=1 Tax=Kitasatospora sp. NPDC058190 TaxID=3346371 RepID=UPI0036DF0A44
MAAPDCTNYGRSVNVIGVEGWPQKSERQGRSPDEEPDEEPDEDEEPAGIFLLEISGPESEEEFKEYFTEKILPVLHEKGVSVHAAHNDERYFLTGYAQSEPPDLITLVENRGWVPRGVRLFLRAIPTCLPHGAVILCNMPHNQHQMSEYDHYRECKTGHRISDDHNVRRCPDCGRKLK